MMTWTWQGEISILPLQKKSPNEVTLLTRNKYLAQSPGNTIQPRHASYTILFH